MGTAISDHVSDCVCVSGLLSFTILHYALAFTAVVLFYVYYTQPDGCTEHKVFISLNLIFCIIVSVVSILPRVQVLTRSSGMTGVQAVLYGYRGYHTVGKFFVCVSDCVCLTVCVCVPGGPAPVRSAAGLPHLSVHHVRHLVGHDQQPW